MPIALTAIVIAAAGVLFFILPRKIEIPESSEVILEYNYLGIKIYKSIYDESEIRELKTLLHGTAIKDSPSCGFSEGISITFTGKNRLVLCPALDGCPLIRIGVTGKYLLIPQESRMRLNAFLGKYGFKFPAI
jgi:hypothetical protein